MKNIIEILTVITKIVPVIDNFVEKETGSHVYLGNVSDDYDYENDVAYCALQKRLDTLLNNIREIDEYGNVDVVIDHYSNNSFDITVNTGDYDTIFNHVSENVNQVDYKYNFFKKWSV